MDTSLVPQVCSLLSLTSQAAASRAARSKKREHWLVQHREWERQDRIRRQAEAVKASRGQLLQIVYAWGLASRIEVFFEDAARRATGLDADQRQAMLTTLDRARRLLGGADALRRFGSWHSPEERGRSFDNHEADDPPTEGNCWDS